MTRRFFVLFAHLLAFLAYACSPPPTVEQLVIAEIREMEAEIEAGERLNFIRHVSEDFRGQGGTMNREQLRAFVILQFRRYENLQARLMPISVEEISEIEARASFSALLTGGADWVPEDGQLYRIETFWRLEDGEWLLTAAEWTPTSLGDAL